MDSSFVKAVVQVPHLSGFDKSHHNLFTGKVGTIVPILIDELIPSSKFDLKLALNAQLPPMASDTFMRCSVKVEAFLVPFRLLAGSFESWFTDQKVTFQSGYGSVTNFADKIGFLPCIGQFDSSNSAFLTAVMPYFTGSGTLADYLGMKNSGHNGGASLVGTSADNLVSAMPWLCYHRVYDDWYRNTLVQRPVFVRPGGPSAGAVAPSGVSLCAGTAPYYFFTQVYSSSSSNYIFSTADSLKLADGVNLYELRQRNFGLDYFTTATPSPQLGNAVTISFGTDPNGNGSTSSFSIAALRAANSLQQFEERNLLAGTRYVDQLRARYGANLSSGVAQRSIFLGSGEFEVISRGVYQSNPANSNNTASSNPFDSVSARYGSAFAQGGDFHVKGEVDEPCYLLVNATLVPRVTYSSGIHRRITHFVGPGSLADLATPLLQNVGPQPVYQRELTGSVGQAIFGFTDRYAEYKTMEDELHGIVRAGSSLSAFALQRLFAGNTTPQINTSFLQIPTTYMDDVTAVTADLSNYGYWCDCYFDYRVVQPLAKYSLPSLQDPAYEHGREVVLTKGGQRL